MINPGPRPGGATVRCAFEPVGPSGPAGLLFRSAAAEMDEARRWRPSELAGGPGWPGAGPGTDAVYRVADEK